VVAGGKHLSEPHEGRIAADPFRTLFLVFQDCFPSMRGALCEPRLVGKMTDQSLETLLCARPNCETID
jgi:hypothetical protein